MQSQHQHGKTYRHDAGDRHNHLVIFSFHLALFLPDLVHVCQWGMRITKSTTNNEGSASKWLSIPLFMLELELEWHVYIYI